ncbi:MAG: hypothetical protein EAZ89_05095 [Bacteroidetes bacterium]|nr:MAG: hypothetical protein EAZ89_05095 [Bacteroidota bacterium]
MFPCSWQACKIPGFFLSLFVLISSCTTGDKGPVHPDKQAFTAQMDESCGELTRYIRKIVRSDGEDRIVYQGDSLHMDKYGCAVMRDLHDFYDMHYDDPYRRGLMDTLSSRDTLIARAKSVAGDNTALVLQKTVRMPDGKLRFVYSETHKSSWLYQMQVHSALQFDSLGRYQTHRIEINTDVPLIGGHFHTIIKATGFYE